MEINGRHPHRPVSPVFNGQIISESGVIRVDDAANSQHWLEIHLNIKEATELLHAVIQREAMRFLVNNEHFPKFGFKDANDGDGEAWTFGRCIFAEPFMDFGKGEKVKAIMFIDIYNIRIASTNRIQEYQYINGKWWRP